LASITGRENRESVGASRDLLIGRAPEPDRPARCAERANFSARSPETRGVGIRGDLLRLKLGTLLGGYQRVTKGLLNFPRKFEGLKRETALPCRLLLNEVPVSLPSASFY
jgi:hypothetical protein